MDHLTWLGHFIVEEKPDVLVNIGDFADMQSLCHFDKGKKCFEGRRYADDCRAAQLGMQVLFAPLEAYQEQQRSDNANEAWDLRYSKPVYEPKLKVFLLGNHEARVDKAIEQDAILEGTISMQDLGYEKFGWKVIPFLQTVKIEGVNFCHYFVSGSMGRPVASAKSLLQKKHQSCVMGHTQQRDIAFDYRADGKQITALFTGAYYEGHHDYLGPQGNVHFRGVWMLKDVVDGEFEAVPYTLEELRRRYA